MKKDVDKIIKWLKKYCDARGSGCGEEDCRTCTACPQLHYVFAEMDKVFTDEARRRLLVVGVGTWQIALAASNYRDGTEEASCCNCNSFGGGFVSVGVCLQHDARVRAGKVCDEYNA